MKWTFNSYAKRWECLTDDGVEWRINKSRSVKAGHAPFNLSAEGEPIKQGTFEELIRYVDSYKPYSD